MFDCTEEVEVSVAFIWWHIIDSGDAEEFAGVVERMMVHLTRLDVSAAEQNYICVAV